MRDRSEWLLLAKTLAVSVSLGVVLNLVLGNDNAFDLIGTSLGAVVIWTVIFGIAFSFFKIQDTISKSRGNGGIRSKDEDQVTGLDIPEMGVEAYPHFVKN